MQRKRSALLKWLLPLAALSGLGIAASGFLTSREQERLRQTFREREVVVERRTIRKVLYLTGKVLPASSINVYSPVSGQITAILVKEGDRVAADQPLFSVKQDSTGQKELETRRNDVERARLDLESAEDSLSRIKSVGELFAQTDRDKAEMEYQRKRLEYDAAVERLALLEDSLGLAGGKRRKSSGGSQLSTIFVQAPRNSFVTLISKSIGDAVIGTTTGNQIAESEVMTLSDVDQMIVRTKVLESDLELVSVGTPVTIRLDAFKSQEYRGKVVRVSQQGIDDKTGGFTYFMADVSIENQDAKVRAQMNASLQLFVAEKANVLAVPVDAVATSGDHSVVERPPAADEKLTSDRSPVYREVKAGLSSEDYVEILDGGVKEGERLLRIDYAQIDPKALAEGKINPPKKSRKGAGRPGGPPHGP